MRDGLAVPTGTDAEGRSDYTITPAGRAELKAWFDTPIEVSQRPRNDLAIKLALALSMPTVDATDILHRQRTATMRTLQHYTLAKRHADEHDTAWLLVIDLMIFHAEAEARWLDHCEATLIRSRPLRTTDSSPDHQVQATEGVLR